MVRSLPVSMWIRVERQSPPGGFEVEGHTWLS